MRRLALLTTLLMGQAFAGEAEFLKLCRDVNTLPSEERSTVNTLIEIGSGTWGEEKNCDKVVQKLKTMRELDIPGGTFHYYIVDSVKPIATLDWIESLSIDRQIRVTDITPLANLNLKQLNIEGTSVSDVRQLLAIPSLEDLRVTISSNNDLNVIGDLPKLKTLSLGTVVPNIKISNLQDAKVTGLSIWGEGNVIGLDQLVELESLTTHGVVLDARELIDVPLKQLSVGQRQEFPIENIEHLGSISTLESLNLSRLSLKDIKFVENLRNLKVLNLSDNIIRELSPLAQLTQLQVLDLSYNEISIDPSIYKLKNLVKLNLSSNRLSFVNVLNHEHLEELNITYNNLHEVRLGFHPKLRKLALGSNQIRSTYLRTFSSENIPSIEELDLSHNKLSVVSMLGQLKSLKRLGLDDNKITSIRGLLGLKNLDYLSARSNLLVKDEQLCPVTIPGKNVCDFLHQEVIE